MTDDAAPLRPPPPDAPCPACGAAPFVVIPDVVPKLHRHGSAAARVEESGHCAHCGARFVRVGRVRRFTPWLKAG